ncbi:hypothetical protein [Enhygromyxa salina]|uniref:Uncharacterized protein n=1 Tax=Enhygromyxa salina TaxID=215803 RepID=A0A2S9YV55_9BACT|nr:hypothetical protein [Enhygromyxa salina]PRQ08922.1 hypothetical protein ENSA7_13210 [Enhygromyxa salina]
MVTTAILSAVLATSEPQQPGLSPPTPLAIAHVERTELVDAVQITAHDANRAIIGTIVFWVEPDGAISVISDYPDGFAQSTISLDGTCFHRP